MKKLKTSFSGHDKFDCKIDWVVKGLSAFYENNTIFMHSNIEKSISKLGLGINMIKSLSHWMKALGLIKNNDLTKLGEIILDKDPYLENDNTLWLLHWNLTKRQENTTLYYLFFNKIYLYRFTKEDIFKNIIEWLDFHKNTLSHNTIKSDIDVFLRMYSSEDNNINMSLLSGLNIITKNKNQYSLNINATIGITDEVFLYILNDYILLNSINESMSIEDIQRGHLSIQKSLCMSENSLFLKIHKISDLTNDKISYSEASGIRQLYIKEKLDESKLLQKIFA